MRTRKPEKLIAFRDVEFQRESGKAFLIDFGDVEPIWIPKSQIRDGGVGDLPLTDPVNGIVVLTEWIAQQKGLA